jgi:hypothetical protein
VLRIDSEHGVLGVAFVCAVCGKPITDVDLGMAFFSRLKSDAAGKPQTICFAHKGSCGNSEPLKTLPWWSATRNRGRNDTGRLRARGSQCWQRPLSGWIRILERGPTAMYARKRSYSVTPQPGDAWHLRHINNDAPGLRRHGPANKKCELVALNTKPQPTFTRLT